METRDPTHDHVRVGDLRLHVVTAGRGRAVVLLHGFPDFWYTWRLQIPALVTAGYRVIAPDLRGYNLSDKPRRKRDYRPDALVADIVGLIERTDRTGVVLVGHDWGGVVAWLLAAQRPELVRRLVILNAPHPQAYRRSLLTSTQLLKSWYAFLFQVPWLPERALRSFDFALLEGALRAEVHSREALTPEDIVRYKRAWAEPGALRAALHYYRMAHRLYRGAGSDGPAARVSTPTLVLWGERDPHLDARNLNSLERWVADLRVERFPEAGHWVHLDAPERVTALIAEFGRARPAGPGATPAG